MNQVKDLHELCEISETRLAEVLENAAIAKTLWEFIHTKKKDNATTAKPKGRKN